MCIILYRYAETEPYIMDVWSKTVYIYCTHINIFKDTFI